MGTINSSDRIVATLYSVGTLFVSGIYVYIPCIKEIVKKMMMKIIITSTVIAIHGDYFPQQLQRTGF
jgi:hypothetical protein